MPDDAVVDRYIPSLSSERRLPRPPIAVQPPLYSRRIAAQRGTFTLHGADETPLDLHRGLNRHLARSTSPEVVSDRCETSRYSLASRRPSYFPSLPHCVRRSRPIGSRRSASIRRPGGGGSSRTGRGTPPGDGRISWLRGQTPKGPRRPVRPVPRARYSTLDAARPLWTARRTGPYAWSVRDVERRRRGRSRWALPRAPLPQLRVPVVSLRSDTRHSTVSQGHAAPGDFRDTRRERPSRRQIASVRSVPSPEGSRKCVVPTGPRRPGRSDGIGREPTHGLTHASFRATCERGLGRTAKRTRS